MKPIQSLPAPHTNRGFVSVIAVMFLVSVVVFILGRSVMVSGTKSRESQLQFDSVAAQALAESGLEVGMASLTAAVNLNDNAFLSSCGSLVDGVAHGVGRGTFEFLASNTGSTNALCPIRVKGSVNGASRTLESQATFSSVVGTAGYGTRPSMTLRNPYNMQSAAVFNLAWRRQGSDGQSNPPGGQASAISCTLPSCGEQWNLNSQNGTPGVGSLGTYLNVSANDTVQVDQTLDRLRNYAEVGLVLGGLTAPPVRIGRYFSNQNGSNVGTTNNTATAPSPGTTNSGEANNWCLGADTLVFGVSGRSDNATAEFSSMTFNSSGSPAQPIAMARAAHYPSTDPLTPSPNAAGDVFSEIWWTHNPYIQMTSGSSSGTTTITVASTTNLKPDTYIKVYSGTAGAFPAYTRVKQVIDGTTFIIDQKIPTTPNPTYTDYPPTTNLSNAVICGGICALFNNPSSTDANTTTFTLTRSNTAGNQWAGGFVCFSGVDRTKVRRVSSSSLTGKLWHEIVTGE